MTKQTARKKWPVILGIFLLSAVLAALLFPNLAYRFAENSLSSGDRHKALAIFQFLGDFQDSPERVSEIERAQRYDEAAALLEQGSCDAAAEIYAALGDYRDAPELYTESVYQKAVSLLAYGNDVDYENIAQARELFRSLGKYKASAHFLQQFRSANTYISRTYTQSGETLSKIPQWYNAYGQLTGSGTDYDKYTYNDKGLLSFDGEYSILYDEEDRIEQKWNDEHGVFYFYDENGNEYERRHVYYSTMIGYQYPVHYDREYNGTLLTKETFYYRGMLWSVDTYVYDDHRFLTEQIHHAYSGRNYYQEYITRYIYNENGTIHQIEYVLPNTAASCIDTYHYGFIWIP